MTLALLALAAIGAIPATVFLVMRTQERFIQTLLGHLETAARMGEPKDLAEKRLALEEQKLRLQQALQNEMAQRRLGRQIDTTS
jgi:uncharacterized protein (DUF305 family)